MKKTIFGLLLAALLLPVGMQAQGDGSDHMALFRSGTSKESLNEFRTWFRDAYLKEFRLYKKEHKADYKYREGDFKSCTITFLVDTLGRPQVVSVAPAELSSAQMDVLHATFESSPDWVPAFQNGRKVRIMYTLPVRE